MATNRVFSLFQEKKYEDFFPSIKIKYSNDIFWKCDLIDVIIEDTVITDEDLNIFEKTILRMFQYNTYTIEELSEIICIKKDLVEYLTKKLIESKLLSEKYKLTELGENKLSDSISNFENKEKKTKRVKMLRFNNEFLPYIHVDEKFSFNRVIKTKGTKNKRITFEVGNIANATEINGYYIFQNKRNSNNFFSPALKRKIKKVIKEYNKIAKNKNINGDKLQEIKGNIDENNISITYSGEVIFHTKYVIQDGNVESKIISDGFQVSVDTFTDNINQNQEIFDLLDNSAVEIKDLKNDNRKKEISNKKYSEIHDFLNDFDREEDINIDILRENFKKNQKRVDNLRKAIEWALYYYLKENNEYFNIIYETFSKRDAKSNGDHLKKILKENRFKVKKNINFFNTFKINDTKILKKEPELRYLLSLLVIESSLNRNSLVFELKNKFPNFINNLYNLNEKSKEYRHNNEISNFKNENFERLYDEVLGIITILLPDFESDKIKYKNYQKYSASQKKINSSSFFKLYFGNSLYEKMNSNLREMCMELMIEENGNTLITPLDYILKLSQILENYLYRILKNEIVEVKIDRLDKKLIIKKIEEHLENSLPETLMKVKENYIKNIFLGNKSTLGSEVLVFLYFYFILKEKENICNTEIKNEKILEFIEVVNDILCYRGHGTDISLVLNNEILLKYRNKVFDFIKFIEKDGDFSGM